MSYWRDDEHPDASPERRPPAALGDLLGRVTRRRGWAARLEGARVFDRWDEVAGAALAVHVQPVRLHGGVLVVAVATPAWASQVRALSGELAARANAVMGAGTVRQVTVVVGRGGTPGEDVR